MKIEIQELKGITEFLLSATYSSVPNKRAARLLIFGKKNSCLHALFGATRLLNLTKFSFLHDYLDLQISF